MSNFPTLMLEADSRGLEKGVDALDRVVAHGEKAAEAADNVAGGFKKTGAAADGVSRPVRRATDSITGMGGASRITAAAMTRLAGAAGALVGALASGRLFGAAIREAEQFETTMFRIEAVIKATGGAAGRSADQLRQQARQLALGTLESTEGVLRAQQTLLTFRQVQGDVFDRAITAAADLSSALGGDMNSAAMQLGRALEDPIRGITALTRSGTVFTEAQRDVIQSLVETGQIAAAQTLILSELEAQYGGTAAAAAQGLAGAKDTLKQRTQELLLALDSQLGLSQKATAAYNAMAEAVLFLTEHMQLITSIAGAAGVALVATFTPAIISATGAVLAFVASLITLRGALIATGIGALIVGAGVLIDFLLRLRSATGSWGEALSALGNLASGVWEGIKTSAASIGPALGAVWQSIKRSFFDMIGDMIERWAGFLQSLATSMEGIPLFGSMFEKLQSSVAGAQRASGDFAGAAMDAGVAARGLRDEAASLATEGFDKARDALDNLRDIMSDTTDETTDAADAARVAAGSLNTLSGAAAGGGSRSGGGAAGAVNTLQDEIKKLNAEAAKGRTPLERYNRELERLNELRAAGLSDAAFSTELERMNEELANSSPLVNDVADAFGNFIAGGLRDFKGFAQSILKTFQGMLSQMISAALRQRIMIPVGLAGGGAGGAASAATGALGGGGGMLGGGGGMLGGILGTLGSTAAGTVGTGLIGGAGNALGIGLSSFNPLAIGTNAAMAGGGMMATIGAALPLIAGIGLIIAAFSKKVETVHDALNVDVSKLDAAVSTTNVTRTKRFFGLSNKVTSTTTGADAGTADPIRQAVQASQAAIMDMASILDVGADVFENFSHRIVLRLTDMSDDQRAAAVAAALQDTANGFADLIPGLRVMQHEAEDLTDTLQRVLVQLGTVNNTMEYFGKSLFAATVYGAQMADELVNMIGGMDAFSQAHSFFAQNFFTEAEQLEIATRELMRNFSALGVAIPESIAAYRELIEAQDLTTSTGRSMYASLLQIAPAFVAIEDATAALRESILQEAVRIGDSLGGVVIQSVRSAFSDLQAAVNAALGPLRDSLRVAQEAARESQSVVNALRTALRAMRMESQRAGVRTAAQATLRGMLGGDRIHDTEAFRDALSVVQEPSEGLFSSFEDYQRDFFRTAGVINALKTTAGHQLTADEQIVAGIQSQIDALTTMLDLQREQITATLSIADALAALNAARANAPAVGGGGGGTATNGLDRDTAYLAANPDVAAAVARGEFASGAEHFVRHGQFEARAFARGGMHSGGLRLVGEQGPELEATGPSRIYSAQQTQRMLGGGSDEMAQDMRELKEYTRELVKINIKQERRLREIEIQGESAA